MVQCMHAVSWDDAATKSLKGSYLHDQVWARARVDPYRQESRLLTSYVRTRNDGIYLIYNVSL